MGRGIALLPLSLLAFVERHEFWFRVDDAHTFTPLFVTGWAIAICGPLALAVILRGRAARANVIATVWVLVIGTFSSPVHSAATDTLAAFGWNSVGIYFWAGAGALGLVTWGLLERRVERINLGVVGFALTVLIFYFSDVMDKLGRSASLIGMGVLLLVGGWILERARRQLVARMQRSAA